MIEKGFQYIPDKFLTDTYNHDTIHPPLVAFSLALYRYQWLEILSLKEDFRLNCCRVEPSKKRKAVTHCNLAGSLIQRVHYSSSSLSHFL